MAGTRRTAKTSRITPPRRPDREPYYMNLALAVRLRADCVGRKVGAVLIKEDRVIATGYNGTPSGMRNCSEGGCVRCQERSRYPSGHGYDVCICVHAEQNTLLSAAKFGNAAQGAFLYTTLRPCFSCLKEALQAGVRRIYYMDDFQYDHRELQAQYRALERRFDTVASIRPASGSPQPGRSHGH